ncbi:hypothetical protein [Vibrio campbellii]|uniref:hypothetical protein n=1 Tax=Vibrio campbellii TaxID=680 RepID=UPI0005EEF7F1|nr:hypothetical protein [Vibrio campbellii]
MSEKEQNDYSKDWAVEPNSKISVWDKHTPIIPEIGINVDIANTGRGELTIRYEYGVPFMAGGWKLAKEQKVARGETVNFTHPGNSFYHQRITVQNDGSSKGYLTIYYPS